MSFSPSKRPLCSGGSMSARRAARFSKRPFVLNITSMIDMFTILLIFLLVNFSSDDTVKAPDLDLPNSEEAGGVKRSSVPVAVTQNAIVVDGATVARIDDVYEQGTAEIPELVAALAQQRDRAIHIAKLAARAASSATVGTEEIAWQGRVTLSGDQNIPFELLRRVIYSCGQASFAEVSLAMDKATEAGR
ncbi:MAG: hypothetical protein CME06_07610 [Gemmatimonadetes bacterium]|nr:hypothetical protein [Gemmatimonadota bacterium]